MLPFLKNRRQTGIIISHNTPNGIQESHSEDDEKAGLHSASEDLIRAVHEKNVQGVSAAIEAAFDILDAMPHVEGEHVSPSEEE